VPDDGIGYRIPQAGNDHDDPQPECTESEADIADQYHELTGDIEQGYGNDPAKTERNQLLQGNAILWLRNVTQVLFLRAGP
jgi:hypothetical protein